MRLTPGTKFVLALTLLMAWSVLAFGGVYPWAHPPILIGAALVGLWGARLARQRGVRSVIVSKPLLFAVAAVAAATAVQLIPMPRGALASVSPAAVRFLDGTHLLFAQNLTMHALSVNPRATATALAFLVTLSVLLFGLSAALHSIGARRLVVGIVTLAMIVAAAALIQHAFGGYRIYGFWTPIFGREPFGPFVNRNHFTGWMVMAFGVSLGYAAGRLEVAMRDAGSGWRDKLLWWSSPAATRTVVLAACLLLMAASILLTASRSGAAALGAGLVFFAAGAWRHGTGWGRRLLYVGVLSLFVTGILAWANTDTLSRRLEKQEWLQPEGRVGAWSDTIRVSRDFWLTGSGLNTFGDTMLVYQRRPGPRLVHAHSDYLQLAAEGGVLLGVPILLAIGLFARLAVARFRERADDPMTSWIRTGAGAAIGAIALQELVEGSLQMPGNAVLFTVLVAIAIHRART